MTQEWLTHEWLNKFNARVVRRGSSVVFCGKAGRQQLCRINFLAKRKGMSLRRFLIEAIIKGCKRD